MSRFYIEHEPWPLKKALKHLEQSDLSPYRLLDKIDIKDEDTLAALGTEDYIQLVLEDTDAAPESPVRKLLLFITYYPFADRVPHVPEECFVGAGYQRLDSSEMRYTLEREGGREIIPGTHLVFQGTTSGYWEKLSQFYLFSVNGIYASDRDSARFALNKNMFAKHSYFSKVEWNFMTGSSITSYLDKDEARKAGEKLLAVVLPILESDYWPKKEDAEQGGK